jgi:HEPN domain-containing protein
LIVEPRFGFAKELDIMTQPLPAHYAEKQSIVKSLFIDTADDNYILARFCFHANLDVDFFWLAVHCLEKYLKAALLINGRSSIKYTHNIVGLYDAVHPLAPELLPDKLMRPQGMPSNLWRDESAKDFIERIYRDGEANNRYQLFGYSNPQTDYRHAFSNPVLERRLLEPLDGGPENFASADELWKWVRTNIYLPPKFIKDYEDEREARKAKHMPKTP